MFDSPHAPMGNTVQPAYTREGGTNRPELVPPLPYAILSGLLTLGALFAALFAVFPLQPTGPLQMADGAAAVALLVVAVLLWSFGPRSHGGWALDAALASVALLVLAGIPHVPDTTGQLAAGLGLVLFAIFAAYFRPWPRFLIALTIISVSYGIALLMNPAPLSVIFYLLAVCVMAGTSLMVAVLGRRLHEQAYHDTLTGLLNRRGMELMAYQVQAISTRIRQPVTVGIIDLDDFKSLNDRNGHAAGDQMIIDVTEAWRHQLRRSDVLARFGGDEFVLVLPGATPKSTDDLVARARGAHHGQWSAGFAQWQPGEDLYSALARADEQLYRAKAHRRVSG